MKLNWAERLAVNNPLRPLQQRLEINWYQRHIKLDSGARILEIGCGRGAGSYLIRKTFRPRQIYAMDLDIDMIKKAETYLSPERREKIAFFVGDVCQLPYPNETMDAVFGFGILHHIPDWQGALKEIVRVLKIGGIYCFEELYPSLYQNIITRHILLHPTENRFRSEELKLGIAESGLVMGGYVENKYLEILGFATKK
jgi:ubiquinone/menaquinone biosynthesis C-methylase UbiE